MAGLRGAGHVRIAARGRTGPISRRRTAHARFRYVLTAHHCISTQAVADTAVAWWFYKRDACGSSATPTYRITDEDVGAERLATSAEQDSTLLRFRGRIPSGLTFSGYTNRNIPAPDKPDNFFEDLFDPGLHATIPAYGLHHPDGGVMKYSRGSIVFQDDTSAEGQTVIDAYHVKRSSPPSGNSTSMLILIAEAPGEVTDTEETMDPSPISSQSSCGARSPWNSSEMARCTPI